MDDKERQEARAAVQTTLNMIEDIKGELRSAKGWGWVDLFGGGAITSMIKRGKINAINQRLKALQQQMETMVKEIRDVEGLQNLQLADGIIDQLFDVIFDNPFTDFMVQRDLNEINNKMCYLQGALERVYAQL